MLLALEAIPQPWLLVGDDTEAMDAGVMPTIPVPAMDSSQAGTAFYQPQAEPEAAHARSEPSTQVMFRRVRRMVPIALGVFALLMITAVLVIRPVEPAEPTASQPAQTLESPPAVAAAPTVAAAPAVALPPEPAKAPAADPATAPDPAIEPATNQPAMTETTVTPEVAVVEPAQPARVASKDPWARPVPRALNVYRKAAVAGERGNERAINALRRYNSDNPTDARGHLVLAQLYRNRNWRDDAFKQYTLAYQRDPSARGAPDMLQGLLQLVARGGRSGTGAARLIQEAYGPEALLALDRAVVALKAQNLPAVLERITKLRDAITR
jgi:hypothetical protein